MLCLCADLLDPSLSNPSCHFLLHSAKGAGVNDSGMVVLDVVFRTLAVMDHDFLGQAVPNISLVEYGVTFVFLVVQHVADSEGTPCFCAMPPWNDFLVQHICDCLLPEALKVHGEDSSDDRCFRFVYEKVTVDKVKAICRSIAVEAAGLHPLLVAPTHIPRYRLALLLSGHTGECNDHLTIQFAGVDALFLEVDADSDILE